ncbi:MAG: hypothetical protein AAFU54_20550 [Chloroflexota bacterium]
MSKQRLLTVAILVVLVGISIAMGLLMVSQGRSDSVITRRNVRYSIAATQTYIYEFNSTIIAEATATAGCWQTQAAQTATASTQAPTP